MRKRNLMPLNLQFFAEGGEGNSAEGAQGSQGGENGASGGNGAEGNSNENSDNNSGSQGGQKTFTQEEMTATATKEKRAGKNSILKLFGCEDEKTAKEEAAAYLAWKESQKTQEQKNQEAQGKLQTDKTEAEKRATLAENKLAVFMAGVNKDSIEDALAIASLKVTEDKDLSKVLEEMKEQPKYRGFFSDESSSTGSSSSGTGSGVGHGNKGGTGKENIGERLGKQQANSKAKKSSYFKN